MRSFSVTLFGFSDYKRKCMRLIFDCLADYIPTVNINPNSKNRSNFDFLFMKFVSKLQGNGMKTVNFGSGFPYA